MVAAVDHDLTDDGQLRAGVLDPDGASVALVYMQRVEHSRGLTGQGVRAVLREENRTFTLETRALLTDMSGSFKIVRLTSPVSRSARFATPSGSCPC
jgi:hypothetical protein